jgi:hypothetical protein
VIESTPDYSRSGLRQSTRPWLRAEPSLWFRMRTTQGSKCPASGSFESGRRENLRASSS